MSILYLVIKRVVGRGFYDPTGAIVYADPDFAAAKAIELSVNGAVWVVLSIQYIPAA